MRNTEECAGGGKANSLRRVLHNVAGRAVAILLLALLLAPLATARPGEAFTVRVVSVDLGTLRGGSFERRPDRVFQQGESIAVQVRVEVQPPGREAYKLRVSVELLHPLGPPVLSKAEEVELVGRVDLSFTYAITMQERMPTGYYTVRVSAAAGGSSSEASAVFFYVSRFSLENLVELEYEVVVRGQGEVKELLLALPSDPWLTPLSGPLVVPAPSSVVRDSLGNAYAAFRGLRVQGELVLKVKLLALQRLTYVAADAPLSTPPGRDLSEFLKPSPRIEVNDPEISSLAHRLVEGASTYREAVARILDYVSSNIVYDEEIGKLPGANELGAAWTLRSRRGVCIHFARLFVALARAAGIPARVVEGVDAGGSPAELHAYAEVYIPGYGWLPVEPQAPSKLLGFVPPSAGYVALVRGFGESVELEGSMRPAVLTSVEYLGSLDFTVKHSASVSPGSKQPPRLELRLSLPSRLLCGDKLRLTPPSLEGGGVELWVKSPSNTTSYFKLGPGGAAEVELNETGLWRLEVFAWAPGRLPAYTETALQVDLRPLNLSISVLSAALLRRPVVVVRTNPPVPGARVVLEARTCYSSERLELVTGADGAASAELGTQLLPCPLEVYASTSPPCHTPASAERRVEVAIPAELQLAIGLLVLLAAALAVRRVKKSRPEESSW